MKRGKKTNKQINAIAELSSFATLFLDFIVCLDANALATTTAAAVGCGCLGLCISYFML